MFNNGRTIFSFIDLLACALGGTIVLMLVFSVAKESKSNPAGTARNFVLYEVEVSDQDALLMPYLQDSKGQYYSVELNKEGEPTVMRNGFLKMNHPDFYAWGPSYKVENNEGKYIYQIYGVVTEKGPYKFGVYAYSDNTINEKTPYTTGVEAIANKPFFVTHRLTMRGKEQKTETKEMRLGQFSSIKDRF